MLVLWHLLHTSMASSVDSNPGRRVAELQAGAAPTREERRLALVFDAGDARDLAPEQLAVAMMVSLALGRQDPGYKAAVDAAWRARTESPARDVVAERVIDHGGNLALGELDAADGADRRRCRLAYGRAAMVAGRAASEMARPRPSLLRVAPRARGAGRPRGRRVVASRDGPSGDPDGESEPPLAWLRRAFRRAWGRS